MSESAAPPPPAEPAGEQPEGPSKKALKKAEKEAKKAAEKARRAAEREEAESKAKAQASVDLAVDNYGDVKSTTTVEGAKTKLADINESLLDQKVCVRGWIQNSRAQGAKMVFLELRAQGSWTIQCVVAATASGEGVSKQMIKWIGGISLESYVLIEATIKKPLEPVKSTRVSNFELHVSRLYCVAPAPIALGLKLLSSNRAVTGIDEEDEPVSKDEAAAETDPNPPASLATHLSNLAMHKRAPVQQAIANIRVGVRRLYAQYLDGKGFVPFEPPCLIGASSEGGANVFTLPYFEKSAYLAQSPQFYKQFEIAGGRERVYSIGPVFRAENSNTPRHMTEFTGLDLEMEIEDNYHEVRDMLQGVLLHIFRGIEENFKDELALVRGIYPSEPFLLPEAGKEVCLTFAEGQKLLREEGPEEYRNVSDDEDMSTPQEKALGALIREKFHTDFYVLDKFPEGARPFYTIEDPENPKVCNAFDFFMRGQEILSGGQRIHLPDQLEARIRRKGIDPASPGIKEYVDVFRSVGVPPHGGGGIGLDRVVAWYLNLPSVHLAAYYPRTPKRLTP